MPRRVALINRPARAPPPRAVRLASRALALCGRLILLEGSRSGPPVVAAGIIKITGASAHAFLRYIFGRARAREGAS